MTQFTNSTFSVGGKHCNGCSQRDVWLEQKDKQLKMLAKTIADICLEEGHGYCGDTTDDECLIPCEECPSWRPCQREACLIAKSIL
jgi:hypothetical protein